MFGAKADMESVFIFWCSILPLRTLMRGVVIGGLRTFMQLENLGKIRQWFSTVNNDVYRVVNSYCFTDSINRVVT